MQHMKKVTQKDRYGNTVSYEFESPMKPVDPTKLMEKQMEQQMEVPAVMAPPPMQAAMDHPGEPQGSDTVPAWLTPGEFVMNREGKDIMEREVPGMLEHFNNRGREVQAAQGGSIPEYHDNGGLVGWLKNNMAGASKYDQLSAPQGPNFGPADPSHTGGKHFINEGSDALNQRLAQVDTSMSPIDQLKARAQAGDTNAMEHLYNNGVSWGPDLNHWKNVTRDGVFYRAEGGDVDEFDAMVKHIEGGGLISQEMHDRYGQRLSEAGYMADGGPVYLEAGGQGLIPRAQSFWNDITTGPAVPSPVTIPTGTGQEHIYNKLVDSDRERTGENIPYANEEWAAPTTGEQIAGTAGALGDIAATPYNEYWSDVGIPFTDATIGDAVDATGAVITSGVDAAEDYLGVDLPGGTEPEPEPIPETVEERLGGEEALDEVVKEAGDIDQARADLADLVAADEADPASTTGPGEDQPGDTPPPEVVEQAAQAQQGTPEGKVQEAKAKGMLEGLFGDLFDKKELARMAVLAAGSMALGYSPLGSMRWAAGQYIGRLDAKAGSEAAAQAALKKNAFDLAKTGKYTPESVRAYENSGGNLAELQAMEDKKQSTVTGNTKKVTGPGGKAVSMQEWKHADGHTLYSPDGGKTFLTAAQVENGFKPHEPAFEKGTTEYRARRSRSLGYSEGRFKEIREQSGLLGENDGIKSYATDIPPGKAASQFWDFAERNGLDPESDGALNIMTNAYENAIADGKASGVKHTDLKPFLEQEYIREQTGNPDLFVLNVGKNGRRNYVDATKMTVLDQSVDQLARSKGVASQDIYQSLVADWGSMDDAKRQKFMDVKIPGETPFFSYMQAKMSSAYGS